MLFNTVCNQTAILRLPAFSRCAYAYTQFHPASRTNEKLREQPSRHMGILWRGVQPIPPSGPLFFFFSFFVYLDSWPIYPFGSLPRENCLSVKVRVIAGVGINDVSVLATPFPLPESLTFSTRCRIGAVGEGGSNGPGERGTGVDGLGG